MQAPEPCISSPSVQMLVPPVLAHQVVHSFACFATETLFACCATKPMFASALLKYCLPTLVLNHSLPAVLLVPHLFWSTRMQFWEAHIYEKARVT
eukprot:1140327-Pelagomonas_calceolata.AAC.5